MKPLISVIIPTYQHADTIVACLNSVFSQTYPHIEVIVVNDGSTDSTKEILEDFADRHHSQVKLNIIHQKNQGVQVARNNGLKVSNGDLIILCDADVIMRSDMLEKMEFTLRNHPYASYAYSSFKFGFKKFSSYAFSPDRLKRMNYIHTTSLVRKKDFPGFDPHIKRLQDWDVWLTMLEQGKVGVFIPEQLFKIHHQKGRKINISSWTPSFMHRIPWNKIGWIPKKIKKYEIARKAIQSKHSL